MLVCIDRGISLLKLNEEHGPINIDDINHALAPGDKIEIIPRHGCTTIPLFDGYFIIRKDHIESIEEIYARGMNQ
ncbi:MAG: hypothetical protein FVQ80_16450 [Planctomycetes bacterium]|nr:hypothetical protein [Planctomycetota bacterium]